MSFEELLKLIRRCDGNPKTLKKCVSQVKDARNAHGDSLLHILAAEGDDNAVAMLLKIGCAVNAQNKLGSTAIDCAAWREARSVVCQLIDAGANIAMTDTTGFTVIDNLKLIKKNEMVELILSRLEQRKG